MKSNQLTILFALLFIGIFSLSNAQNNALSFDGLNDRGTRPMWTGGFQGDWTVESWVRPDTFVPIYQPVFEVAGGGVAWSVTGGMVPASPDYRMVVSTSFGGLSSAAAATPIPVGQWTHMAWVYESGVIKFYINGILDISSGPITFPAAPGGSFYLGYSPGGGPEYTAEALDEFRIWDRALTSGEINSHVCNALTGNESGLQVYYDFNQGIANGNNSGLATVVDRAGGDQNLSIIGFTLNGTQSNWVPSMAFQSAICAQPVVPTLSQWGLIMLGLLLLCLGGIFITRGRDHSSPIAKT
jgi:hypothetical protein